MSDGHDPSHSDVDSREDHEGSSQNDMPTAAYELVKDVDTAKGEARFYYGYDPRHILSGDIYKTVNPLVRRTDAEKAMRVAQGDRYQDGYVNGMKQERQRVLDLIEEMKQEVKGTRLHSADVVEAFNELREEVEQE